jgi:DNA-directed RNA polymerase specialized sigma24 family protein
VLPIGSLERPGSALCTIGSPTIGSVPRVKPLPAPRSIVEPVDQEVGRRFLAGEEQALAWAYERLAGQLHGMSVRAFGPGPDAEDVTQQVFVAAWTGRAGYRPESGPLPAWLVGICRHKIADAWARRDRQRRANEAALAHAQGRPGGPVTAGVDTAVADRVVLFDELDRLGQPKRGSSSSRSSRTSPTPRSPPAPGCRWAP